MEESEKNCLYFVKSMYALVAEALKIQNIMENKAHTHMFKIFSVTKPNYSTQESSRILHISAEQNGIAQYVMDKIGCKIKTKLIFFIRKPQSKPSTLQLWGQNTEKALKTIN